MPTPTTDPNDLFAHEHRARTRRLKLEALVLDSQQDEHAAQQHFEREPSDATHTALAVATQKLKNARGALERCIEETHPILEGARRDRDLRRLEELTPLADWKGRTTELVGAVEALVRNFAKSIVPLCNSLDAELQGAFVAEREANDVRRRLGLGGGENVNRMPLSRVLQPIAERLEHEHRASRLGGLVTSVSAVEHSNNGPRVTAEFRLPYSVAKG